MPELAADFKQSSHSPTDVPNDLAFLIGLHQRIKLLEDDLGLRAFVMVGKLAITANYFSESLTVIDLIRPDTTARSIALGPKAEMSLTQRRI